MEKEEEEIKKAARETEKRAQCSTGRRKNVDPSTQLWTVRYAPQSLKEICGNNSQVGKLQYNNGYMIGDFSFIFFPLTCDIKFLFSGP